MIVKCKTCGKDRVIKAHSSKEKYLELRPNCNPCSNKLIWESSSFRKKQLKNLRRRWQTKSSVEKLSKSVKKLWKDPEYREKQEMARKKDSFLHPRRGKNNIRWKGDLVGYDALLNWVYPGSRKSKKV